MIDLLTLGAAFALGAVVALLVNSAAAKRREKKVLENIKRMKEEVRADEARVAIAEAAVTRLAESLKTDTPAETPAE